VTSEADRQVLLRIARDAIVAHVSAVRVVDSEGHEGPVAMVGVASQPGAAFVTIHRRGELRGCIGHLEADEPLGRVIWDCAVSACSADPRFAPVTASELPDLEIELSLLGALEPAMSPADIIIGRHGLVVERGRRRGLLLPQVAIEWAWDRETFLAQTCHKAGLPRDAWKHGALVWRFEAEVFGD
jgi:AmmeMemoRadiSam system protein A